MSKVRIEYIPCGHTKITTKERLRRGEDQDCNKCKTKPKKGTMNPSPA